MCGWSHSSWWAVLQSFRIRVNIEDSSFRIRVKSCFSYLFLTQHPKWINSDTRSKRHFSRKKKPMTYEYFTDTVFFNNNTRPTVCVCSWNYISWFWSRSVILSRPIWAIMYVSYITYNDVVEKLHKSNNMCGTIRRSLKATSPIVQQYVWGH